MSNTDAMKKLLELLNPYKRIIFLIAGCLILSTGLNLFIPILSKEIIDKGFVGGNKRLLFQLVIVVFIFHLIEIALNLYKEKKRINIASNIHYHLSEQSFKHLMRLRINYFDNTNDAEILNNLDTDIRNMECIADESLFFVVTQAFSMIGGIIGLFIIDIKLTILVLLFIPIKYVLMNFFAKKRRKIVDMFIQTHGEYARWFGDSIGGVKEVRFFGIMKNKEKEFAERQIRVVKNKKELDMMHKWNLTVDSILIHFLVMLIYILGANLVFDLYLSIGSIFAFVTYSSYVTGPISAILNIGYMVSGIIPSTKRYCKFMNLEEEVQENAKYSKEPNLGDIEFKNVSFGYDNEKQILKDISINIPKGNKVAIIGMNGSGKSTIINLLLRLYNVESGSILLDNYNILNFDIEKYREKIAIVNQQVYLFNDTIKNNIKLYKDIDDEIIMEAVRDSGLEIFIDDNSLEYTVGEDGVLLSGGQRQKIALARALVHNKPILIFDEATSNTDIYSEMHINQLLKTKLKDKTVIIVTHKVDILKDVDKIVFLKSGKLNGTGTYQELLETNDEFNEMMAYHNQQS